MGYIPRAQVHVKVVDPLKTYADDATTALRSFSKGIWVPTLRGTNRDQAR
jgi:hypothetical protein